MAAVRILIADDYQPWRSYVRSILRKNPELVVVHESEDGADAVLKSREMRPDLVILEICLPKLNGLEASSQISKVSPSSRVLFLSSYHPPEVMIRALSLSAGYVVKADVERDLLPIVSATMRGERFVRFRLLTDSSLKIA